MSPDLLARQYEDAGYQRVHVRRDKPHFTYPPHYHPHHITLHVVEGQLTVTVEHRDTTLQPGDKIEIDAERFHTSCVGPAGCVYIHAEKQ